MNQPITFSFNTSYITMMVNHDMQLKLQLSPLREQRTILLMLRFIDEQWLLLS